MGLFVATDQTRHQSDVYKTNTSLFPSVSVLERFDYIGNECALVFFWLFPVYQNPEW